MYRSVPYLKTSLHKHDPLYRCDFRQRRQLFFREKQASVEETSAGQRHDNNQERQRTRPDSVRSSGDDTVNQVNMSPNEIRVTAGRLRQYRDNWDKYTSDKEILQTVEGMRLRFIECKPNQNYVPHELSLTKPESRAIDKEIDRLQDIGVVIPSQPEPVQFISNIFARPKKDGSHRMILNLSKLNEHVEHQHFKMDTLETAIKLVTPNCIMASLDLKDAYYCVSIHENDQKYLKFTWRGNLYQFTALPNGLSSGPRSFTKLLKPPLAYLRNRGHIIISYLDDTIIIGRNDTECKKAVHATKEVLEELGFVIHPRKSVMTGTSKINFLGFIIDSQEMTVRPTEEKCRALIELCNLYLSRSSLKIEEVASIVGKIVSMFPGAQFGPLHYRETEKDKTKALTRNKGNYQARMSLSENSKVELRWWVLNALHVHRLIDKGRFDMTLSSDASGLGWGITDGETEGGGRWNENEKRWAEDNNINYLELLAAFMGLRAYCSNKRDIHVKLNIDNTTAIAYINQMGGMKSLGCNELAKDMWKWCIERGIWLTACHLPGALNVVADKKSRVFQDETEWQLNSKQFANICSVFGTPEIDIFASRLNTQLQRFISWRPDPEAEAVDAFSVDWAEFKFYAFPPFCLITRCLQKITFDKADGIIIVPNWPTQPWFSRLKQLMIGKPLLLHRSKTLLTQPITGKVHPLHHKLSLLCCRLSGKVPCTATSQQKSARL